MKKESQYRKCTYKYIDGTLCNRPITRQFLDKGSKLYCIFHIRNDEKLMQLKQQMLEEISKATNSFMKEVKANNYTEEKNKEEINKLRRKHILNYEGAYFPDGFDLFVNFTLEVGISFIKAIFNGQSVFSYTTFKGEIIFHEATFSGRADFYGATFSGRADFSGVIFSDKADFFVATFSVNAGFIGAIFSSKVDFSWATFSDVIYFSVATFNGEADFYGAIFIGAADFSWATFSNDAKFTNVFFIADTLFNGCHLDKGKLKILDTGFFLNCFFHDISEGSNISFINCCFSSVSFLRSRIADTIFSNCIFNMTRDGLTRKFKK